MFFLEPETARALALISAEPHVLLSALAKLETLSQIHARVAGGMLSPARARRLRERIDVVLKLAPYDQVACPADIIDIAQSQIDATVRSGYCRTRDRLHLATMQALGVHRLLTNDDTQAAAARSLGLDVVLPR